MSIWKLSKDHYYWKSPITKIYGDIHNKILRQDEENYIYAITQAIGYEVDKEELIRALQYDREQYDKGYNDGVKETFVEELEKIKEEMIEKCKEYRWDNDDVVSESLIRIVDNHIAELKQDILEPIGGEE